MSEPVLSAERIAEHAAFLARITAEKRATILKMIAPQYLLAAEHELQMLEIAASMEGEFAARMERQPT